MRPTLPPLLLLLACAGCGDGTVTVRGTVAYDGEPVEDGIVFLEPADNRGPSNEAAVRGGSYAAAGVAPGPKLVRVFGFKPEGRPSVGPDGKPLPGPKRPYVPAAHNEKSRLVRDVSPGRENRIDLDLPRAP